MFKILSEKKPIIVWSDELEDLALEQAKNLANLPFIYKHVALMPDVHPGYGMPIGGVIATEGVVIPNAVGVDIGCGMCAMQTDLQEIDQDTLKKIMSSIRKLIPVGVNGKHQEPQDQKYMPEDSLFSSSIVQKEKENALKSIGSLGSGNHFLEIQKGSDGFIWVMIHSGSRNLGYKVASYYNKIAIELNEKWFSQVPKKHQLAFLPLDSDEGQNYLLEMKYCVKYALYNRELMMLWIDQAFEENGKRSFLHHNVINIAHNYATMENHFGRNLMIHRKGATLARKGTTGIIPGCQGTNSYIVEGLGNKNSFMSCSHGAGRVMGRTQAKKELNFNLEKEKLDSQGIIHSLRTEANLDEAISAYKDIHSVMKNQVDLVKIKVELSPLAVIKG